MNASARAAGRAWWSPRPQPHFPGSHGSGRRRRRVKAPEIGAILLVLVLIFAQLAALGANTALLSAIAALANICVAIAVLLLVRPAGTLWCGLAPVLLPLLAALAWSALPPLAAALTGVELVARPVPDAFPLEFAKLIGAFACLLSGIAMGAKAGTTRRFFDIFILFAIGYVLFALLLRENDPYTVYGIDKGMQRIRFTGTLLSANAAACVFGVIAIMTFGRCQLGWRQGLAAGWEWKRTLLTGLCAVATLLALGACALTESRASLALTLVALLVMVLRQWRRPLFAGHAALRFGVPVLLLAGLLVVTPVFGPTFDRFATLSHDAADRVYGMQHFLALSARSPWFGYGLGSFFALNVATLDSRHVDFMWNLGAAHNAPIQAMLEGGWPFALGIVAAVIAGVARTFRARRLETPDPLMLAQLLAAGLVFACALADIALNVPALCAMAAFLSGMALGRVERAAALFRTTARPEQPQG